MSPMILVSTVLLALACGCAASPPPRPVRLADLPKTKIVAGAPLCLELHAGDKLPLDFEIDGQYVRTKAGAAPIELEIVRDVFVLIDEDGIRTSFDGHDFGDKVAPGSFALGLGATRERGAFASVVIRTPQLAEPVRAKR